jgi:hypothetical protein
MSEDDFRESALRLASVLGWPVFPLAPQSKVPVIAKEDGGHGYLDATTDPEQINTWWVARPEANIGVDCGRSRIVVFDLDPRNGGDESFLDLRAVHGDEWLDTVVQLTPGGGAHYIFRAPDGVIVHCTGTPLLLVPAST